MGMIQPPFDNNVSAAAVVIYAVACLFCFVIMLKVIGLARRKKRRLLIRGTAPLASKDFSVIPPDGHDMSVSGHEMSTYKGEGIVCAFHVET